MTQLEGIDVSSYNGSIDWQAVKNAGITFAFIKASQGGDAVDRFFGTNLAHCRAVGIVPGVYHFYRHDVDPAAQAAHFLHIIGQLQPGDLPPTIDVEAPGDGGGPINYSVTEVVHRIGVFLNAVHTATGRNCIIYTYPYVWRELIGNSNAFAATNPLWIAHYGVQQPALVGGWPNYTFWQYTDSGAVPGVGHVDRDRFNGDMAQFDLFRGASHDNSVRRFPPPFADYILYGEFRRFFEAHGDIAAFGNPITNTRQELIGGTVYPYVQWFERARMEWHPEPTVDGVLLGRVGVEALHAKGRQAQSGVAISPRFADYHATHGGIAIFGLAIENEVAETLGGTNYRVQYFERSRLEWNPNNGVITRGLVGVEAKAARVASVPPDAP